MMTGEATGTLARTSAIDMKLSHHHNALRKSLDGSALALLFIGNVKSSLSIHPYAGNVPASQVIL